MKNAEILTSKVQEGMKFLQEQEERIKPLIDYLQNVLQQKIKEQEISTRDAFDMFIRIQELYTNNILLLTKIKEILEFKE